MSRSFAIVPGFFRTLSLLAFPQSWRGDVRGKRSAVKSCLSLLGAKPRAVIKFWAKVLLVFSALCIQLTAFADEVWLQPKYAFVLNTGSLEIINTQYSSPEDAFAALQSWTISQAGNTTLSNLHADESGTYYFIDGVGFPVWKWHYQNSPTDGGETGDISRQPYCDISATTGPWYYHPAPGHVVYFCVKTVPAREPCLECPIANPVYPSSGGQIASRGRLLQPKRTLLLTGVSQQRHAVLFHYRFDAGGQPDKGYRQ